LPRTKTKLAFADAVGVGHSSHMMWFGDSYHTALYALVLEGTELVEQTRWVGAAGVTAVASMGDRVVFVSPSGTCVIALEDLEYDE
jgi:hypothetical protein